MPSHRFKMLRILNIARHRSLASLLMAALAMLATSCQKVPLLAPSGSTITLTSSITALPINGTAQLIAQVIEASGTPPHSGTQVLFTTTLGTIEPSEIETDINGRAIVTFKAGTANGTATITASSGGASVAAANGLKIAIGTAAVGSVSVSANPSTISAVGGVSTITAHVLDVNGSPLTSAAVNFSTSNGALSATQATTDGSGNAQTTLTTSVNATVTATVGVGSTSGGGTGTGGGGTGTGGGGTGTGGGTGSGGSTSGTASGSVNVTVSPLPIVSISAGLTSGGTGGGTTTFTAGSPILFTIKVQPGTNSTAQIRDVTVNFGDGTPIQDLGAVSGDNIPAQHSYSGPGTYTARVSVLDTLGATVNAATIVVVLAEPPLTVSLASSQVTSGSGATATTAVTFTATVSPATAVVTSYLWNFGDGQSRSTPGNQVVHNYVAGSGVKTVTVTVTTTTGQQTTGEIAINP
jgi:adhesin/invasin